MNIWSLLGISVTLVATFCIIMMEVFQDKSYYETYKWYFCGFLILCGTVLWFVGRHLLNRSKKKAPEGENSSSPEENSAQTEENAEAQEEGEGGPFLLFSPLYWGPILVTFGIIIIFIVPLSSAKRVQALTSTNLVHRTNFAAPVITNSNAHKLILITPAKFPEVKLQGIIYRVGNPSVVINGKACFIGDYVEEAEIVAIDRQSMTLEIRGQRKNFVLEK